MGGSRQPRADRCPPPPRSLPPGACQAARCQADSECPRHRRCCYNGCAYACLEAVPPPPGRFTQAGVGYGGDGAGAGAGLGASTTGELSCLGLPDCRTAGLKPGPPGKWEHSASGASIQLHAVSACCMRGSPLPAENCSPEDAHSRENVSSYEAGGDSS